MPRDWWELGDTEDKLRSHLAQTFVGSGNFFVVAGKCGAYRILQV